MYVHPPLHSSSHLPPSPLPLPLPPSCPICATATTNTHHHHHPIQNRQGHHRQPSHLLLPPPRISIAVSNLPPRVSLSSIAPSRKEGEKEIGNLRFFPMELSSQPPLESNNNRSEEFQSKIEEQGGGNISVESKEVPPPTELELFCTNPKSSSTPQDQGGKKNKGKGVHVSSYSTWLQRERGGGVLLRKRKNHPNNASSSGLVRSRSFRGSTMQRDFDALALPLGMSIAAVVAQVLDRKGVADERISADHLSLICSSAVKESLANVFGDRFDCFVRNFEKSFGSTLRTLQLINETSFDKVDDSLSQSSTESHSSKVSQSISLDEHVCPPSNSAVKSHLEGVSPTFGTLVPFSSLQEVQDNMRLDATSQEIAMHGQMNQQLACNNSMMNTFEKSVMEQARSNDLKTLEIGLMMKNLQLEESKLALNTESNHLERFKLSFGLSKASFKVDKFKTQLEDAKHAELLKKCMDYLVAGLAIMFTSLIYGAYVYSYKLISEATSSCMTPPKGTKHWWMPNSVSSVNSWWHMLTCHVVVFNRMGFGAFVIISIAYLLFQRSPSSNHSMPVTVFLLLLGVICGFAGKLCVDALGGSGYSWLLYWEALCLLHFFANVCTATLFSILHGSVSVSQGTVSKARLTYQVRQIVFYILLFSLPLFCGLMPFASLSDWKDHFFSLVSDTVLGNIGVEN